MEYLQKLNRGDPKVDIGVIKDPAKRDPIVRVQMAADMPASERPSIQVTDTTSKEFADYKTQRRNPAPEFYKRPARNLDICGFNAPVQRTPEPTPRKAGGKGKS